MFKGLMMSKVINFYHNGEDFGEFSNFASHPIELGGKTCPTSEHYFQAQQFPGTEHEEAVRCAELPRKAAKIGRDCDRPLRADWEAVKDEVMRVAVRAKFTQHEELRRMLIDTGDATIVEYTRNDFYWSDGGDGTGRNMLGRILMEIRGQLRTDT